MSSIPAESILSTLSDNIFNFSNRIKYYKMVSKYISKHYVNDPNNCINVKDGIIKIGTNIILDNQIGNKSAWGLAFLSHYYFTNNSKELIFATKIVDSSKQNNLIEYNVLQFLTSLNIQKQVCPHFPMSYGALKCNNTAYNLLVENIDLGQLKDKKLLFIFSELANNNLNFLLKYYFHYKILYNAIAQIMLSIMFFNKYTESLHADGHSGNFLYHIINPGGFFHYNINGVDYYIENLGYLWVIWDFGLIIPYSKLQQYNRIVDDIKKKSINHDYIKTLSSIRKHNKNKKIIRNIDEIIKNIRNYDFIYNLNKMPNLVNDVLKCLQKYTDNSLKTSIPHSSKIINKTQPYYFN
jgi:hypothetical protein